MGKSKSVETAVKCINDIEKHFRDSWPEFLNEAETNTLFRSRFRDRSLDFAGTDPSLLDKEAYRYLALNNMFLKHARFSVAGFTDSSFLNNIPPIDLASLYGGWSSSAVILEFNSNLIAELQVSGIDQDVDISEYLSHLPFSCFFVFADHLGFRLTNNQGTLKAAHGFFVNTVWVPTVENPKKLEKHLVVTLVSTNFSTSPIVVPLRYSTMTELCDAVADTCIKANGGKSKSLKNHVKEDLCTVLSALLYIASEKPDIIEDRLAKKDGDDKAGAGSPEKKDASKKPEPQIFRVGSKIGPRLEEQRRNSKRSSGAQKVAPHIRRAHFHTYIVGSKKNNNQRRVLRWVEQTSINMEGKDEKAPIMVRKVR